MKKYGNYLFIILAILIIVLLFKITTHLLKTNFSPEKTKIFYINLDKNVKRDVAIIKSYDASDIKSIPIKRFPAIAGKDVDMEHWLTPEALIEYKDTEKTKTRTHHYQLTTGAVGCFLSHYTLAKQLTEDPTTNYYLIFEDDIIFSKDLLKQLKNYLYIAPSDWDMIELYTHRKTRCKVVGQFYKPKGFWGTQGYIINKKGAKKFVKEVEKSKIDGQIDAYLSRMNQEGKINLYITKEKLVFLSENSNTTDIQCRLVKKKSTDNPFLYKGFLV
jgi:GR25 family glycosyltransferase involved in LPS biosynthesis